MPAQEISELRAFYPRRERPNDDAGVASLSFVWHGVKFHHVRLYRDNTGAMRIEFPNTPRPFDCDECQLAVGIAHRYCPWCGTPQPRRAATLTAKGRPKIHREVAYPADLADRRAIESEVIRKYVAGEYQTTADLSRTRTA